MKNIFYIVILAFLTAYCSSSKQLQSQNRLSENTNFQTTYSDSLTPAENRYVRSEYLLGITQFELGEYKKSLIHLNNAYLKNPNKGAINYALADAYLKTGDLVNAEYYGKQAVNLDPNNKWYHLKLAKIYQKSGDTENEIEELRFVLKKDPKNVQILYELANALTQENKLLQSNQMYNRILSINGPDPYIHLQKYKNFEALGMRDSVISELEAIQKLQPDNPTTLETLTDYYLQDNETGKAKHLLRTAIKNNPHSNEPVILFCNYFISQNEIDSVSHMLRPLVRDTSVHTDRKVELVHYMLSKYNSRPHNEKIRKVTQQLVNDFITVDPLYPHSHTLAATFYIAENKFPKAISELEIATKLDPKNKVVWVELVRLEYNTGDFKATLAKAMEADKYVPDNAFIQFVIGSSYYSLKKMKEAIPWLKKATKLPAENHFKSIIYGILGDSYSSMKHWSAADSAYDNALQIDSTNATVLNNYAYFLSKRNKNLDKAKKMAIQAVKSDPNNSSFLDTMGWVYFKLGDYDKAENYLQQALNNDNVGAEVMEHMGDVYQKKGKPEKAIKWWKKALHKDPARTYLKKKINTEK